MVIELSWIISADDLREAIEAHLVSDSDRLHLGEVCSGCLHRGAEYIEEKTLSNLRFSTMLMEGQLYMEKRAMTEALEECPLYEEFEMLRESVGGPRYASMEEANAAWERGEW